MSMTSDERKFVFANIPKRRGSQGDGHFRDCWKYQRKCRHCGLTFSTNNGILRLCVDCKKKENKVGSG